MSGQYGRRDETCPVRTGGRGWRGTLAVEAANRTCWDASGAGESGRAEADGGAGAAALGRWGSHVSESGGSDSSITWASMLRVVLQHSRPGSLSAATITVACPAAWRGAASPTLQPPPALVQRARALTYSGTPLGCREPPGAEPLTTCNLSH